MLPSPLHPAIVHFPIVFTILLPFVALGALWAIRRGARPARAWAVPLLAAAAVSLSAWLAVQTGEADEERAEDIAGEQVLHAHEEAAERFLLLSGGVVLLMAAGFLRGSSGKAGRVVASRAGPGAGRLPGRSLRRTGGLRRLDQSGDIRDWSNVGRRRAGGQDFR